MSTKNDRLRKHTEAAEAWIRGEAADLREGNPDRAEKIATEIEQQARIETVERIRERFDFDPCHECDNSDRAHAALDEEAAR